MPTTCAITRQERIGEMNGKPKDPALQVIVLVSELVTPFYFWGLFCLPGEGRLSMDENDQVPLGVLEGQCLLHARGEHEPPLFYDEKEKSH